MDAIVYRKYAIAYDIEQVSYYKFLQSGQKGEQAMMPISIRIERSEEDYLKKIADKNNISIGKALKKVLEWCSINDVDLSKSNSVFDENVRKMIEHIHVSIPNLMYLSRMNTLFSGESVSKEKSEEFKKTSLDYINNTCGDFQYIYYNNVRVSINPFGLKQVPSDKETTLWK